MTKNIVDNSIFPDPAYRETVLAPLFEGVKQHYAHFMGQINRAHLVMLSDTAILNSQQVKQICTALEEIDKETDIDALTYTGEFEDYFFLVDHLLREKLGDLGGALHTARSRNDMDHTLFKMALRAKGHGLLTQVQRLTEVMIDKAQAERDTLIVAYTHGQPAQPSTFGHYLAAAIEVLLRDGARLNAALDDIEHCPMGAAAITTSGFAIDRQQISDLLGFAAPLMNSYGCIASVDYVTGWYSAMKLVFLHLGRVIQDMAFWSAFEVGQLYVPNALVQISSIMPQKRNPVPIEHLRHLSSATVGRCDTIVNVMHNTPFTDMNDSEGEVQQAGYSAFDSASRVLSLLESLIPACSINSENVRRNTQAACITITELADSIVREEQLTFRQAHQVAADTAKTVLEQKLPLAEGYEDFCEAFVQRIERPAQMSKHAFEQAVSAEVFVQRRDRIGGPAAKSMDQALDNYRATLAQQRVATAVRNDRQLAAQKQLQHAFSALKEL